MDLYCTRCAEPWDADIIHEIAEDTGVSYSEARKAFRKHGCGAVPYAGLCEPSDDVRAEVSGTLFDLLGDDVDGIAAMSQDFDLY
jgi:hypothetical protein